MLTAIFGSMIGAVSRFFILSFMMLLVLIVGLAGFGGLVLITILADALR